MKKTYKQKDEGPRFMAYMRVGCLSEQAALMDEQRTMICEFVQRVGGVVARSWEVEGGADGPAGEAARKEMLEYAKENKGMLNGLLVCQPDRLTRKGPQVAILFAAELKTVGVKILYLPNVEDSTEWRAISDALELNRAEVEDWKVSKLYTGKRVIALLRVSSPETPAETLDHQKSELEAYARTAGFELDWLLPDGGNE